jgi:glycosyltransferase involved in cell wall biosynthesis
MGFYLGEGSQLIPADTQNPRGIWERQDVRELNQNVFSELSLDWNRVSAFNDVELDSLAKENFIISRDKILDELNSNNPSLLKDPRFSLLLPLWKESLRNPLAVIVHRDPIEVARSLNTHEGLSIPVGIALWEYYNCAAISATKDIPTHFVSFSELFSNPVALVNDLYSFFTSNNVPNICIPEKADIESFISADLYHEKSRPEFLKHFLNEQQSSLYTRLCEEPQSLLNNPPSISQGALETLIEFESHNEERFVHLAKRNEALVIKNHALESSARKRAVELSDLKKKFEKEIQTSKSRLECQFSQKDSLLEGLTTALELANIGYLGQLQSRAQELSALSKKRDYLIRTYEHLYTDIHQILNSKRWGLGNLLIQKIIKRLIAHKRSNVPWAPEHLEDTTNKFWNWKHHAVPHTSLLRQQIGDLYALALSDVHRMTTAHRIEQLQKLNKSEQRCIEDIKSLISWTHQASICFEQIVDSIRWKTGDLLIRKILKSILLRPNRNAKWALHHSQELITAFHNARKNIIPDTNSAKYLDTFIQRQKRLEEVLISLNATNIFGAEDNKHTKYSIRITQFTPAKTQNPYYMMLPNSLIEKGWDLEYNNDFESLKSQLKDNPDSTHVIHFHQLEPYYHSRNNDIEETAEKAIWLLDELQELKDLGAVLVWTMHNPFPHDRKYIEVDASMNKKFISLFHKVVVLGGAAKRAALQYAAPEKFVVLPHPAFNEQYGKAVSKDEARTKLEIPNDAFVYGSLGHIKPYKGLEMIIDAFNGIRDFPGRKQPFLLIAGSSNDPDYVAALQYRAGPRVRIVNTYVADEDIPTWLAAFDVSVFAFNEIWGSSSVVLSLSYNVPAVAPDRGCIPEYVVHENTGYLYRHKDAAHLQETMLYAASSQLNSHVRYMCGYFQLTHSVSKVSDQLAKIYTSVADEVRPLTQPVAQPELDKVVGL